MLGLNHVEVVNILKDLPKDVRIVCGRRKDDLKTPRLFDPGAHNRDIFTSGQPLGGSLQVNLMKYADQSLLFDCRRFKTFIECLNLKTGKRGYGKKMKNSKKLNCICKNIEYVGDIILYIL